VYNNHDMERARFWKIILGVLAVFFCFLVLLLCAALAGLGYYLTQEQAPGPRPSPIVIEVTATPTPSSPGQAHPERLLPDQTPTAVVPSRVSPEATGKQPDDRGRVTMAQLARIVVPTRDLRVLGMRFNPDLGEVPPIVNATPPQYQVGDERTFWVTNSDTDEKFEITAELLYITDHAYFWAEKGADVDQDELEKAAHVFETQIYPTDRRVFGEEPNPGVDNDPHITFLHAHNLGSRVAGYFSSADAYPRAVSKYSNEMDMFYINLDATSPGDPFYLQVIAHEFQHMIHWHEDRNEDTWLNEGFSVLAEVVNGYPMGEQTRRFLDEPDLQLTGWSEDNTGPHYGAAGMFTYYFWQRFGEEATQALARHPENGMAGIDAVLAERDAGLSATDLFADWVVANLVNDADATAGVFGYKSEVEGTANWSEQVVSFPEEIKGDVHQYGTDYIKVVGKGPVQVTFQGERVSQLASVTPHSGKFLAWANRGDDSDSRLYREVDLTDVTEAALTFWTWYDIEELWDFAYVVASTDGGEHWMMLEGPGMTREDPYGNNLGVGYSGISGGGSTPAWVKERIDLTPLAGKKILLGFEYITDDALTRPGFFIDDVRIEGTSFADDFEQDVGGWTQEGFVRTDTYVPQSYIMQVIQTYRRQVEVRRYFVEGGAPLKFVIDDLGAGDTTIAVSAIAPKTWEVAPYVITMQRD